MVLMLQRQQKIQYITHIPTYTDTYGAEGYTDMLSNYKSTAMPPLPNMGATGTTLDQINKS